MRLRKGWHQPKRNKMPVQHWPAVIARAAKKAGMMEKLQAAEGKENPLLTAFKAGRRLGKPTMQALRMRYLEAERNAGLRPATDERDHHG